MLLLLINSLLSLAFAEVSNSEFNVRGRVLVEQQKTYLMVDDTKQKLELIAGTQTVATDLKSLEAGDFISGHGVIEPQRVTLDAIEFIGLKRLLGIWIDRDNKLMFRFHDFSSAAVRGFLQPKEKPLNYALVPDQHNRWTIFLGDESNVAVGILTALQRSIRIDMINADTGKVDQSLRLQPVRP